MVSFKDLTSIASSPTEILAVIILQRHTDLIESIEQYQKLIETSDPGCNIIRARTMSLFREVKIMIRRTINDEDFKKLQELVESYEYNKLDQALDMIDEVLDHKNIIRPDYMKKRRINSKVSEENDKHS